MRDKDPKLKGMSAEDWDAFRKNIDNRINGIGNLLLLTPGENASESNKHPADKEYLKYSGGSYGEHNHSRERWRSSEQWPEIIENRGIAIFDFMLSSLVGDPGQAQSTIITDPAEKS